MADFYRLAIRIPRTILLGKLLRLPLRILPKNLEVPIIQGPLKGKRWIVGSGDHGFWLGSWEREVQSLFAHVVYEGGVVFDVGAAAGFYTLLASFLVGPTGRVCAFEPIPRAIAYLKKHLVLNQISNATIIEAAVSDRNGSVTLQVGDGDYGRISSDGTFSVRSVTLDELVFAGAIPPPDFVKIDVEGAELLVLSGARGILISSRPTLFLAVHGSGLREQCCKFLELLGYAIRPVDSPSMEEATIVFAEHSYRRV